MFILFAIFYMCTMHMASLYGTTYKYDKVYLTCIIDTCMTVHTNLVQRPQPHTPQA